MKGVHHLVIRTCFRSGVLVLEGNPVVENLLREIGAFVPDQWQQERVLGSVMGCK